MIFTGFKLKSNQLFFNKHLKTFVANRHNYESKNVKRVLIILDDISKKTAILDDFNNLFGIVESKIDIFVFRKMDIKDVTLDHVISAKDFGWYGKIKSDMLNSILTKKYDLLINYSKIENIYSNLLILQCKTAFNVGFSHLDKRLYDLLIKCKDSDTNLFNKELKKYLAILKKI
jgi:hypothetical protein